MALQPPIHTQEVVCCHFPQFRQNFWNFKKSKFIFEAPCFCLPWHSIAQAKRSHLYFGNYAIQDSRNLGLGVPALKSNLLPAPMARAHIPNVRAHTPRAQMPCTVVPSSGRVHLPSAYNSPYPAQALVIMLGLTGNRHNCPAPRDV